MSWRGRLLCSSLVLGAVLAPVAGGGRLATPVNGTVTLAAFDPKKACTFSNGTLSKALGPLVKGSKVVLAQCSATGTYAGLPRATGASYGWDWYLQVGKNGATTGLAVEIGGLTLKTASGSKVLIMEGLQKPVGVQTSAKASALTTGEWGVKGATKVSGTYTFETERKGSKFTASSLKVKGSI